MKQSRVRLSFCLSVPSVDSSSGVGRFAAERPAGRRYRSAAAGVGFAYQLQARSAATAPQRRSAANAGSVMLTADVHCTKKG